MSWNLEMTEAVAKLGMKAEVVKVPGVDDEGNEVKRHALKLNGICINERGTGQDSWVWIEPVSEAVQGALKRVTKP